MQEVLSLIGSLLLIGLVLVLTYYATRWYARRAGRQTTSGKYIRVLDRSMLGAGAFAVIIEVSGRYYLLAVADKSVTLLRELPDFEETDDPPFADGVPLSRSFRQLLERARRNSGKGGDPPL